MKGILADANIVGQVEYLAQLMQSDAWVEFWQALGLVLQRFPDVGLANNSSDIDIWNKSQEKQLILITNNRNDDGPDSLENTIRRLNHSEALPVFTLANVDRLRSSRAYADRVVERL